MRERIALLIDTAPGVDGALAILMALSGPEHEVVGLTIAAGSVGLDHTVANALKLCEVAGVDVLYMPTASGRLCIRRRTPHTSMGAMVLATQAMKRPRGRVIRSMRLVSSYDCRASTRIGSCSSRWRP